MHTGQMLLKLDRSASETGSTTAAVAKHRLIGTEQFHDEARCAPPVPAKQEAGFADESMLGPLVSHGLEWVFSGASESAGWTCRSNTISRKMLYQII